MSDRIQIENRIRDWLSVNPQFIEPDFITISKEYFLSDAIGSKGFVDLLCKDRYGNFVIVELKRSDNTARQTINEVLKYHALIKQRFRAKDSEIRIVIVSTHWNELIRAFSELVNRTTLSVVGYEIQIDSQGKPYSIEKKEPLSDDLAERKFSREIRLDLFGSTAKRSQFKKLLKERLATASLEDFVTIDLDDSDTEGINYPYVLATAFQQPQSSKLKSTLAGMSDTWSLGIDEEDYDEEQLSDYLLVEIWDLLRLHEFNDTMEAGYPEKFDSILHQGWTIKSVEKFGYFKSDPRLDDTMLIDQIRGVDGNNRNKYDNIGESNQPSRIEEMQKESQKALGGADSWAEHIYLLFDEIKNSGLRYRIALHVYNPDSCVFGLYQFLIAGDPRFIPSYLMAVEYLDRNEAVFYIGELAWSGRKPVNRLMDMDAFRFVSIINGYDNEKDAFEFGLSYVNRIVVMKDGQIARDEEVHFDNGVLVSETSNFRTLVEFGVENKDVLIHLGQLFQSYYLKT